MKTTGHPVKPFNPWLAVGLSMLAPGLGQLYTNRPLRALVWFAGALATTTGCLNWILSEIRYSSLEGALWFTGMLVFEVGSWFDAYRVARSATHRRRRRRRPALAAALSVLFPGLGHVYVYSQRWFTWLLLAPVFLTPGIVLLLGEALETPPAPGWPNWLMQWPTWLTVAAGTVLSAVAIVHAYTAAFRRHGHRPRLPRMSRQIWTYALAAWMVAQLPWGAWLKTQVKSFKIPSSSMEPTLLIGDRIWAKPEARINRGDLIVFKPPDNPGTDYIKRVIGLPGEQVTVSKTTVLIDGRKLDEPYAVFADPLWRNIRRDEFGTITVPEGSYFVMGDNRDNSKDSRYFGPVPRANIFGHAYKRFWPLNRTGPLN